ncbi:MAG: epoxyqueuosine reductase [Candidatus Aminicenantes bacterium]|nr:epoxyqueuosine reductase [Candidatus Aminicenantes bacterium]
MAEEKQNYRKIKEFALDGGLSLFGVADITEIREEICLEKNLKKKFDRGISLGKRLIDAVLEDIKDSPTPLYFQHYRQLNFFLDRAAFLLSSRIQELGFQALPIPASQILDWEKQSAHLSHKKIGYLAGLGYIGRNNLLVNPELGARFRLVTVLTDMPIEIDKPLEGDCGECRACLEPCPAQAINERKEDFDHMACFEKLKEFRKQGIVGQHICGVCVKACPGMSRQ